MSSARTAPSLPTVAAAVVLIAAFVVQVHTSAGQKSAILHEALYTYAGYRYLTRGDYEVNFDSPPLLKQLAALPLLSLHLDPGPPPGAFLAGPAEAFLYRNRVPAETILARARLPFLALGVLLGVVVFAWTHELYGSTAALVALWLYAFSPALLGQAGFANHDFGLACLTVVSLYAVWRLCRRPTAGHALVAGVALGLALVTKFTAVALVPTVLVLGVADAIVHGGVPALARRLALLAGVVAVATLVLWADYGFSWGTIDTTLFRLVLEKLHPDALLTRAVARLPARFDVPAAPFVQGAAVQMIHGEGGHVNYLFGEVSYRGWWYYYLVTFLYRAPLALFALCAVRLVGWRPRGAARAWAEAFVLFYAVLTVVLFSLSRTQLGERYVLTVYPLLFVFVAGVTERMRTPSRVLVAVCLLAYAGSSWAVYPDYLMYFNRLAGGPDGGFRKIVEGVDLGQDFRGLERYVDAHDIPSIKVSCFGCPPLPAPRYAPLGCQPTTGWVAVSVRQLVMPEPFLPHGCFDWLAAREPVARIGRSLYVYDLEPGSS